MKTAQFDEASLLMHYLPPTFNQAIRMVEYLSSNPKSPSDSVIGNCPISNLSDIARRANPYLIPKGYMIGCERPIYSVMNESGEPSNKCMFLWSIYCIPAQANDD